MGLRCDSRKRSSLAGLQDRIPLGARESTVERVHGLGDPFETLGSEQRHRCCGMSEDEGQCHRRATGCIGSRHIIERTEQQRGDALAADHSSSAERTPRQHRRPELHRSIEDAIARRRRVHHREFRLDRRHWFAQMGLEGCYLRGSVIGNTDGTDETPRPQIQQRRSHFGRMRKKIGTVDHVQVHRVDTQSTQ